MSDSVVVVTGPAVESARRCAGVIASRTVDALHSRARQIVLEYYVSTGEDPLE
jgi:hypothetical protein